MTDDTRMIVASNLAIAKAILQTHYLTQPGVPTISEEKQVAGMFNWGYKVAGEFDSSSKSEAAK